MNERFHNITTLLLKKLTELYNNNIGQFDYELLESEDDFACTAFNRRYRERLISYITQDDQEISVSYEIASGHMFVLIEGNRFDIFVGPGSQSLEIKKLFIDLFNQVKYRVDVEMAEKEAEEVLNALQGAFPDIFDSLLLGDLDDEEEVEEKE